ncbi:MAG: hypothetical protein HQK78_12625 [Desulfobacterales bacterium]|nr:hypothetical protein [Desulfobacterales bacterium]
MNRITFESKLLPDGHLYCPKELTQKRNSTFKVIVIFDDNEIYASNNDIEQSAINDLSDDLLSEEELRYYLNLEEI